MPVTYFLGANTPDGFSSRYPQLFDDKRLTRVIILKGGSGCGKSTLMKAVRSRAEACSLATEQVLCSSDPDSLDALIVPQLRLAIADGTAPHVLEPPLCGCGAEYLDLGRFYDRTAVYAQRDALFALKRENAALYPPACRCLRAAASLTENLSAFAGKVSFDALSRLLHSLLPADGDGAGSTRSCYFSAVTPKGSMVCSASVEALCPHVYVLDDSFGAGQQLLQTLFTQCATQDVITACDPLAPQALWALLLPQSGTAFVRSSQLFAYDGEALCRFDLDAPVLRALSPEDAAHAQMLLQTSTACVCEAASYLRQAKALHDRIELLYRPCVDFAAVSACTQTLLDSLFAP